jgi:hypothetical protein
MLGFRGSTEDLPDSGTNNNLVSSRRRHAKPWHSVKADRANQKSIYVPGGQTLNRLTPLRCVKITRNDPDAGLDMIVHCRIAYPSTIP